jgi:phage baseplate assembly protein W
MAKRLTDPPYLSFPLRIGAQGGTLSDRGAHVRDQIEQVLFTLQNERVFRPEFGAGVQALLFEPSASAMWQVTRKRLVSSLAEALAGEVDPRTLAVDVTGEDATLTITVAYALATLGVRETQSFTVGEA